MKLRKHRSARDRPLTDAEVLELLQDEPELIALADAIATTQHRRHFRIAPNAMRKRTPIVILAASTCLAALATALIFAVFGTQANLVDQALAAVGDGRM